MIDIEKQLQKAGLTGNEAKVYLELIKKGSLSANELSKKIGMDRTLSYTVLNHLIEKGMANYIIRHHKKYFQAVDPEHLLNPVKEREAYVLDVIQKLKRIEKVEESKREVNVFEGIEGMRTTLKDLVSYEKGCAFGSTLRAYDLLFDLPYIAKKGAHKMKEMRLITTTKYKDHKMVKKVKWINYRYLDIVSDATTVIVKDKVAIYQSLHKPIIIVIHNEEIAQSYQNHFEVLWKAAKEID